MRILYYQAKNKLTNSSNYWHFILVFISLILIYICFFSSVLFASKIFAVGDNLVQNLPNFLLPPILWTDKLHSGFPLAADPQVATWYPLKYLCKLLIPNLWLAWNSFVISAYILASFFTYGYIYTITNSKLASFIGGIIYGMSGFMIAHLEHTNMIHSAAWLPLSLWALEKLRFKFTRIWFVIGVISITFNILAGHPQISIYSLVLIIIYALILGFNSPVNRNKYYRLIFTLISLGIGLCFLQILPMLELANLGVREKVSFDFFNEYSLPPHELIKLIFPYLFGGSTSELYSLSYFGSWSLTETTGYVGILSIILATIGYICNLRLKMANFWLTITVFSLLLSLGNATPLGLIMYHLPIVNKFRGLARHFCEMSLGISILAGMGIATIQNQKISRKLLAQILVIFTGLIILSLIYINQFIQPLFNSINSSQNINKLISWQNFSVIIPLIMFAIGSLILTVWSLLPKSKIIQLLLVGFLIIDLASFGYFFRWNQEIVTPEYAKTGDFPEVALYRDSLESSKQRMLSLDGIMGTTEQIRPNLSLIWNVPNASNYNPLNLKRYSEFLNMNTSGTILDRAWINANNQSFNLLGIRYVFMPEKSEKKQVNDQSILYEEDSLELIMGRECAAENSKRIKANFLVKPSLEANQIAIVSSLGCATNLEDNQPLLNVNLNNINDQEETKVLKVGRDVSEWAYDCPHVLPFVKHKKAQIFSEFEGNNNQDQACEYDYITYLNLNQLSKIKSLDLEYIGNKKSSITLRKVFLIDTEKQTYYPLDEFSSLNSDNVRWHKLEIIRGTSIYENKNVMPRVWLVPEVKTLAQEDVLMIIKNSLPLDNLSTNKYNPDEVALVEESLDFKVNNFDSQGKVKIIQQQNTLIEIESKSKSAAFLVLNDLYYPGWQATIDGQKTHIFQTNYLLRGIVLPEGNHLIKFQFKPLSFYGGIALSLAFLFGLLWLLNSNLIDWKLKA